VSILASHSCSSASSTSCHPFFFYCYRHHRDLHSFPTRRSSDLCFDARFRSDVKIAGEIDLSFDRSFDQHRLIAADLSVDGDVRRSEEHTSELQSLRHLVCRLLLEKKK